ncbi:hypothetical protein QR77_20295 [Streptomyces sp. 150FB]|uniref:WD40 repeat domain-containing serine/threonine protein kinase n=1 Tax=Streptomyces sp. 150FB TaxID=1576605 RepID=UPI0005891ACF|nr:serine/threonine-protein kinase [Streptomyces sp. 150FB]KIF75613.1 hypothetical protein QR77_20295 [Streptomyces sp. 150FB]
MSQPGFGPSTVPPGGGEQPGWPTTPPPHRALGPADPAEIGPYRLEAVLGAGGMGRVFLGRTPAGSAVAVKVVHREYASDRAFRKRFEQEVGAARRVQGLYTVPVVDADLRADEPWLATAYVPGPSLHDAVAEYGPLSAEAAVGLVARVAEALQSIHSAEVIHRDLKPSNIILTAEGPKVIDFGIARAADVTSVTGTGMLTGTPAYMAPEYLRGQSVTEAVDVFALGVVACFAVTGRPAFGGGSHHGVTYRILEEAPDLDGCPEPLRTVAAGCLEKDPQRRSTLAEVIRRCYPAAAAGSAGGEGHTVLSPPRDRTVVSPGAAGSAAGFHDAATAPAASATTREPAGAIAPGDPVIPPDSDTPPSPPSPDPLVAPVMPLPALITVVGVLVLVGILIAFFLPDQSGDGDKPSTTAPFATLTEFAAATGNGTGLEFSPDGNTLAAGGEGSVQLWDVAGHKLRAALPLRDKTGSSKISVRSVAFSPDGRLLAAGTDGGEVEVLDVAEGRQVGRISGSDPIHTFGSVAFSPDSELLATGGDDGIQLWDARSGKDQFKELADLAPEMGAKQVAFSPDGRTLASAGNPSPSSASGEDDVAQLWDVSTHKARETLHHPAPVLNLAFSPDGRTLVTSGEDDTARLWGVADGSQGDSFGDGRPNSPLHGVAFSPDGKTLAIAGGADVALWDPADHKLRTTLVGNVENVINLSFSPDGRLLATHTYDGRIRLWKTPQP